VLARGVNIRKVTARMNKDLAYSLDRTLLLMRDEIGAEPSDEILLNALSGTSIALVADAANLASHSAQTALITAATLMARSGHKVYLIAPNVELIGPQPPLRGSRLIDDLLVLGKDLLPGVEFGHQVPSEKVDLAIAFGNSPVELSARRLLSINCTHWAGIIAPLTNSSSWMHSDNPFGALAAGGLAASEAFKVAMHKLLHLAPDIENSKARFAFSENVHFQVAPEGTPPATQLGPVDWISGGAMTQAALYCLARIPNALCTGRVFEPDTAEFSNLNRYLLLRRSQCGGHKATLISTGLPSAFCIAAVPKCFDETSASCTALVSTVVVGVDHIPSRWLVQEQWPHWLAIGATSHWCAMASYHEAGIGCARCLHNSDEENNGPLPTCAVVSFWAGLLVAAFVVRQAAGQDLDQTKQQIYMTPFRPERPSSAAVPKRPNCPVCAVLRKAA
jgi:hypothetical protein